MVILLEILVVILYNIICYIMYSVYMRDTRTHYHVQSRSQLARVKAARDKYNSGMRDVYIIWTITTNAMLAVTIYRTL